jgi:predicted MPP superfamily phosphohydrolase
MKKLLPLSKSGFLKIAAITIVMAGSLACEKFEYNPYQTEEKKLPTDLNNTNISKLKQKEATADDTITILFTGDSQRFYARLDALVDKVKVIPDIDFLIMAGDISDFGLAEEFGWVYNKLETLQIPYICAVGNHDLVANGSEIYQNMFGAKNFSFIYKKYKFLFHDTNGREYAFNGQVPNMTWLSSQLNDPAAEHYVGVAHIQPYDADFDPKLEEPYANLISSTENFRLVLNGHQHGGGDSYYYDDGVRYITSYGVENDRCLLLKLYDGKVIKQEVYY